MAVLAYASSNWYPKGSHKIISWISIGEAWNLLIFIQFCIHILPEWDNISGILMFLEKKCLEYSRKDIDQEWSLQINTTYIAR